MRTTIDLPEDLHAIALALARDEGITLSQAVAALMRRAITPAESPRITVSPATGLKVMSFGRVITSENVKALENEL